MAGADTPKILEHVNEKNETASNALLHFISTFMISTVNGKYINIHTYTYVNSHYIHTYIIYK